MPLSPNGKVSPNELPEPTEANTVGEARFTAPRSEMEKTVAEILCHLLGVERVDVESNFFALGAHSLVGAQLIARLRRIVGVEMSLRVLFTAPTVAALSAHIERRIAAGTDGVSSVREPNRASVSVATEE
jgi:acyl carrier protein